MEQEDKDFIKALIFASGMFGLWILSTSLLLARLEKKIDAVAVETKCISYKVTDQLGKPYKGAISLDCLEEVNK